MIVNEGEYIADSILSGLFRQYNYDGTIDFEAMYNDGEVDGFYRSYHGDNGFNLVRMEGVISNGNKIGTWKYFYPNGNPRGIEIHDSNGTLTYGLYFFEEGMPISEEGGSVLKIPTDSSLRHYP